jgi:hypothetical protein
MAVHRTGSARVGSYPREEAVRLQHAATEMAAAEGAPLGIVVRRSEIPGPVAAAQDTVEPPPQALPPSTPQAARGFLVALLRRLSWRVPEGNADSSDGMIVALAVVGLGVWMIFDRYAAGSSAQWTTTGPTGITWYAAGLVALTWALDRVARTIGGFRHVLAGVLGSLPLVLALALVIQTWAPATVRGTAYVFLSLLALAQVGRTLTSAGASRPRTGMLAVSALTALFLWGTGELYVNPHLWYEAQDEDGPDAWAASERLLFEQADRIDSAAAGLRSGQPDRPDVFFVGFAGDGGQKVFAEEIQLSERIVSERYDTGGRALLLVNDRRDLEKWPLATVHGLRRALSRIGERMDRSEDVLFLMLTSHGSSEPSLLVSHQTWPLEQLDAQGLRSALDDSSIKWRVVVISACYSGAFIQPLADENTMIFTSAAKDRVSFGCSDDRDLTDFGGAFIRDALPRAPSLATAFEQARLKLAERERREARSASLPQAHLGAAISAHWKRVEARTGHGAAGSARE